MSNIVTADRLDFQRGVQTEPLTDHDIQLVHRYLSDPTIFPREFKRWVTEHSSDTVDIAKTQVHGLVNGNGQVVIGNASIEILGQVMPGVIMPYAAVAAPAGWLLCDGHEILRADYAVLFALIGTSWGTPSGSDKFKLPDLRGRTPFGSDGNVPFAGSDGAAAGARGPAHHHHIGQTTQGGGGHSHGGNTDGVGDHNHAVYYANDAAPGSGRNSVTGPSGTYTTGGGAGGHSHNISTSYENPHTHFLNGDTDGGGPLNTVGWVGINWIIGSGVAPP